MVGNNNIGNSIGSVGGPSKTGGANPVATNAIKNIQAIAGDAAKPATVSAAALETAAEAATNL